MFTTRVDSYARLFTQEAYAEAAKSKDPSTQLGAVLVAPSGRIIGRHYNRFPRGVIESEDRLNDRNEKYPRVCHAEEGAIWSAVRGGFGNLISESTLYVPWYACDKCAIAIIESGVKRVCGHQQHPGFADPHSKWAKLTIIGLSMLAEAGVICELYNSGDEGCGVEPVRIDYKFWKP